VIRLSDRCTVLRDGCVVDVSRRGQIEKARLMQLMAGRDLQELHRPHEAHFGEALLATDSPREEPGFTLRRGEILGLAGLLGAGTSTYLRGLFGAGAKAGATTLRGTTSVLGKPSAAIGAGIGLIPGDRRQGLVMGLSIRDNIVLPHLARFDRRWGLDRAAMDRLAAELIEALDIRPADSTRSVRLLSGGNQQKVLFARWLVGNIDVLLLDEPTQGIDIGAKARVHRLMRQFVDDGGGILFASTEMEELMSMSDTVLAMGKGKIIGRLSRREDSYSEGALRAILGG
jgi:ABC-type sugar transport system ATPase subunit